MLLKPPLRHAPGQRHLAAFKADANLAAAAGLLALVTPAGGLTVTGTGTAALPLAHLGGAGHRKVQKVSFRSSLFYFGDLKQIADFAILPRVWVLSAESWSGRSSEGPGIPP